jgi:fructose-bisphosphate aldolase, class I
MTPRVRKILSWCGSGNAGVLTNLVRPMNYGRLAGTGRLVLLPIDQDVVHGAATSPAASAGTR